MVGLVRTTATGATLSTSIARPVNRSRNFNVQSTTAAPSTIAGNSQSLHTRPTLVKAPTTKANDYLLIVVLIVALLILTRKA
jgi:hypothetical protein